MKRDKYDTAISDLVRFRADFTCQRCKLVDTNGQMTRKSTMMDCSHYNGRGAGNVCRYDTDLLACLCKSCHGDLEHKPGQHTRFIIGLVGQGLYDMKEELHSKPHKMTKADKEEMLKHYRAELVRVGVLRANGAQGYIETKSWF